jgi:hypothetical protein
MRYRVQADPLAKAYSDLAITPVIDAEDETLEMYTLNDSARAAVGKARAQATRHKEGEKSAQGRGSRHSDPSIAAEDATAPISLPGKSFLQTRAGPALDGAVDRASSI